MAAWTMDAADETEVESAESLILVKLAQGTNGTERARKAISCCTCLLFSRLEADGLARTWYTVERSIPRGLVRLLRRVVQEYACSARHFTQFPCGCRVARDRRGVVVPVVVVVLALAVVLVVVVIVLMAVQVVRLRPSS